MIADTYITDFKCDDTYNLPLNPFTARFFLLL